MLLYRCAVEWVDFQLGDFFRGAGEPKPPRARPGCLLCESCRGANGCCQPGLGSRRLGIAAGGANWLSLRLHLERMPG